MDDELLTALADTLREHGVADARVVLDVARVAARILGRDRCMCRQTVHVQHHETRVPNCRWCDGTSPRPAPRKWRTDSVPTQGLL